MSLLNSPDFDARMARHFSPSRCRPSAVDFGEPAETLGDTTPGAFDPLPLLEHPAVLQADADVSPPAWAWALMLAVVLVGTIAFSAFMPWGFALPPAP